MMLRRGIALVALVAAMGLGAYVQTVGASHAGSTVDCGSAGTFTLKATPTPAGPGTQAPYPWTTILFEEGGVLTVFKFVENGIVAFDKNEPARANNNVDEVTCRFTFRRGPGGSIVANVEVTGILTP